MNDKDEFLSLRQLSLNAIHCSTDEQLRAWSLLNTYKEYNELAKSLLKERLKEQRIQKINKLNERDN